jgi:hypothetical protein
METQFGRLWRRSRAQECVAKSQFLGENGFLTVPLPLWVDNVENSIDKSSKRGAGNATRDRRRSHNIVTMSLVLKRRLLFLAFICAVLLMLQLLTVVTSKYAKRQAGTEPMQRCIWEGQGYSQGALIRTDEGVKKCDHGKWETPGIITRIRSQDSSFPTVCSTCDKVPAGYRAIRSPGRSHPRW